MRSCKGEISQGGTQSARLKHILGDRYREEPHVRQDAEGTEEEKKSSHVGLRLEGILGELAECADHLSLAEFRSVPKEKPMQLVLCKLGRERAILGNEGPVCNESRMLTLRSPWLKSPSKQAHSRLKS